MVEKRKIPITLVTTKNRAGDMAGKEPNGIKTDANNGMQPEEGDVQSLGWGVRREQVWPDETAAQYDIGHHQDQTIETAMGVDQVMIDRPKPGSMERCEMKITHDNRKVGKEDTEKERG